MIDDWTIEKLSKEIPLGDDISDHKKKSVPHVTKYNGVEEM